MVSMAMLADQAEAQQTGTGGKGTSNQGYAGGDSGGSQFRQLGGTLAGAGGDSNSGNGQLVTADQEYHLALKYCTTLCRWQVEQELLTILSSSSDQELCGNGGGGGAGDKLLYANLLIRWRNFKQLVLEFHTEQITQTQLAVTAEQTLADRTASLLLATSAKR